MTINAILFLYGTNRYPAAVVRTGMFCPLDLFRLMELTRTVTINNLAVASSRCHLGAEPRVQKRGDGENGEPRRFVTWLFSMNAPCAIARLEVSVKA